jgi:hypothetical protein
MFVRNAIRDERQHGYYMLTIRKVGIDSQPIDTIETMESCCVLNVITHSTKDTNLKPLVSPNY